MYTAIKPKLMNTVRIQKAQGTESNDNKTLLQYQRRCGNVLLASSQPLVLACSLFENFPLPLKTKKHIRCGSRNPNPSKTDLRVTIINA